MGTAEDTQRLAQQNRQHQVPDPTNANAGDVLTVTAGLPKAYDWSQPPASRIARYKGDPNGALNGRKGDLCADYDTPALWQNTDNLTTWEQVGGSAGSGFPVGPEDDGTATHEIQIITPGGGTSEQRISVESDANAGLSANAVFAISSSTSGAAAVATSPDTSQGSVGAAASDAGPATAALSADANGGTPATVTASSPHAGESTVITSADLTRIGTTTSQKVGFYGGSGIVQAGTPTTLADVIAILQNLGLCT